MGVVDEGDDAGQLADDALHAAGYAGDALDAVLHVAARVAGAEGDARGGENVLEVVATDERALDGDVARRGLERRLDAGVGELDASGRDLTVAAARELPRHALQAAQL